MARTLTPKDASALMSMLVKEATGQDNLANVNTTDFVSMGETVLATGVENTLNALTIVLGRPVIASRRYDAKLKLIQAKNSGEYTDRYRKISFYAKLPKEAGDWNTDQNINLKNEFDNGSNGGQSTASMWEQNAPMPLEVNFGGSSVWQDSLTRYEYQLKQAFRSEEDFIAFANGIVTEKRNDIESQKEAYNRMNILNMIGAVYDCQSVMQGSAVNLTAEFNAEFRTSYTSEQLRTDHLKEFLEFFTARFKLASMYMRNRTKNYHWSHDIVDAQTGEITHSILRHTPADRQRAFLFSPLFVKSEAMVFPEIFHEDYLFSPDQHELVDYWQSINTPSAVNITPSVPNIANGGTTQIAGDPVSLEYVVGVLFDTDAILTDYQLDNVATTPMEARKHYINTWYSMKKNAINDITENVVLFYMEDE